MLVAIDVTTGLPLIITVPQKGVDEYVLTELGRFLVEAGLVEHMLVFNVTMSPPLWH